MFICVLMFVSLIMFMFVYMLKRNENNKIRGNANMGNIFLLIAIRALSPLSNKFEAVNQTPRKCLAPSAH